MTPACSSSDRFRRVWSLAAAIALVGSIAKAQPATDATFRPPAEPTTPPAEPTPPPAEPTPPPPAPAPASPTATAAAAPGNDEPGGKSKKPGRRGKGGKHRAADASAAEDDDVANAADGEERHDDDSKGKSPGIVLTSSGGSLRIKGRVMALAELSHREADVVSSTGAVESQSVNALDLMLESARIGFEYRSPVRWLSAELELELSGKPKLKDAFVLAGKRFFVKAGQFKLPSPELELESPWALPLARRGLMHDLLTDWLDVAGRRPGVELGYRGKGALKPRLQLGAFQGITLDSVAPGDRDVTLIDHASLEAQTYAARAELSALAVKWGAWYEQRVASKEVREFSHYATFGVDATLDQTFAAGGLRAWIDGSAGQSQYVNDDKPDQSQDPWFVLGRALVAYRFGGLALGQGYVEPFGFFALLDPDTQVVSDMATEAALGVNVGLWDRARVTLQGELSRAQRNFPSGFLDHENPEHMSLLLMAGARF